MDRRNVHFEDLSDVREQAVGMLKSGYVRVGTWSLGTMCDHLGRAMQYSREGFPSEYPWILQRFIRIFALRKILSRHVFRQRFSSPISVDERVTDQEGVDCLLQGIKRFQAAGNHYANHIVLGEMNAEQWLQFHLWHCEHHLSFLRPAFPEESSEATRIS